LPSRGPAVSDNPFAQLLYALTLLLAGICTVVVAVVGSGYALVYMLRLLAATAGAAPMPPLGNAVRAMASVVAFLLVLAVLAVMESGDGSSGEHRSGQRRSAKSDTRRIDRKEASEALDRIEDSLEE